MAGMFPMQTHPRGCHASIPISREILERPNFPISQFRVHSMASTRRENMPFLKNGQGRFFAAREVSIELASITCLHGDTAGWPGSRSRRSRHRLKRRISNALFMMPSAGPAEVHGTHYISWSQKRDGRAQEPAGFRRASVSHAALPLNRGLEIVPEQFRFCRGCLIQRRSDSRAASRALAPQLACPRCRVA